MTDYPSTMAELGARFGTERACRDLLLKLRWPAGFVCPRCRETSAWTTKRHLLVCAGCQYQASLTAGTIFHDSRKPLTVWFRAIWWVTTQKNGASALGLQRTLGLGSDLTAWRWLHKLRRAMVRPGSDRLRSRVEVHQTYLGGLEEGVRGRKTKALIAVACEEDGSGIGRIRLRRIRDSSAASVQTFIKEAIQPGSVVHTDGSEGYTGLETKGFSHQVTALKRRREPAVELLPRVHLAVSLLKRWLVRAHHGPASLRQLDYYLDEFTFRFNRRKCRPRGKLFYRLLQQAAAVRPAPYQAVAGSTGPDPGTSKVLESTKRPDLFLTEQTYRSH